MQQKKPQAVILKALDGKRGSDYTATVQGTHDKG